MSRIQESDNGQLSYKGTEEPDPKLDRLLGTVLFLRRWPDEGQQSVHSQLGSGQHFSSKEGDGDLGLTNESEQARLRPRSYVWLTAAHVQVGD